MKKSSLSIVIPVYRGGASITALVEKTLKTLKDLRPEIVLVNDASPDNSHEKCLALQRRFPASVVYVRLSINAGEHNAVMAGLRHAGGERALIMDDDNQNTPEDVRRMMALMDEKHCDVVFGYYEKKRHSLFRNLGSAFNGFVAGLMLGKPKGLYLCSFKLMNRFVIDEVARYQGPYPYIDGLILRVSRNLGTVLVKHNERLEGRSSYTLVKLIRLWLAMFTNFSVLPLRAASLVGFFFALAGFGYGAWLVIQKLLTNAEIPGWTSLITTVVFFSG
ncbi:MAG: glycosyltransferase family 2 protein, partial [Spirochaetia bacterium]|nr:glycosyltransferase family 2 protein [Spirochaetia bacterium]